MGTDKILYIARNIPLPSIKQNPIILNVAKNLSKHISIDFLYPCEWLPKLPFLTNKLKTYSSLKGVVNFQNFEIKVFKYLRLPGLNFAYLALMLPLNLKSFSHYKLFHAHFALPDGLIGVNLKKKYHKPLIVTVRQGEIDKFKKNTGLKLYQKLFRYVLNNADEIAVPSALLQKQLKSIGYEATILQNAIESSNTCNNKKDFQEIKILCVSRFLKRKNIDWIIKSLKSYSGDKSIVFNLIGQGEEYEYLNSLTKNLNPNIKINFKGFLPHKEVIPYFQSANIFAMPSQNETFGVVYLEAMGNKCATIGLRDEAVYGLFDQEMLFPKDYTDFEQQLHKLIEDQDKMLSLGQKGYDKVMQKFTFEKVTQQYLELYQQTQGKL